MKALNLYHKSILMQQKGLEYGKSKKPIDAWIPYHVLEESRPLVPTTSNERVKIKSFDWREEITVEEVKEDWIANKEEQHNEGKSMTHVELLGKATQPIQKEKGNRIKYHDDIRNEEFDEDQEIATESSLFFDHIDENDNLDMAIGPLF
ncbi:hypothetical protein R1flu_018112 [Riccia fluitans]|uniref:Uncharacterized protein n=1 Tax=Riccia fluitans TaxID=41844 RepID=A0ABD1ZIU2_9MARC